MQTEGEQSGDRITVPAFTGKQSVAQSLLLVFLKCNLFFCKNKSTVIIKAWKNTPVTQ